MSLIDKLKIHHYECCIQDIEAQLPKRKNKKHKIMMFIIKEYKRRIKFFKELERMEGKSKDV